MQVRVPYSKSTSIPERKPSSLEAEHIQIGDGTFLFLKKSIKNEMVYF
jgi:hypothetical protein